LSMACENISSGPLAAFQAVATVSTKGPLLGSSCSVKLLPLRRIEPVFSGWFEEDDDESEVTGWEEERGCIRKITLKKKPVCRPRTVAGSSGNSRKQDLPGRRKAPNVAGALGRHACAISTIVSCPTRHPVRIKRHPGWQGTSSKPSFVLRKPADISRYAGTLFLLKNTDCVIR
jgi:hypothetical protein